MSFALDTRNGMKRFLGNRLKEIIVIKQKFLSKKRYFAPKLGGMCSRRFLACVKKILKDGDDGLRNGDGTQRKGIGHDLVPIGCLSG